MRLTYGRIEAGYGRDIDDIALPAASRTLTQHGLVQHGVSDVHGPHDVGLDDRVKLFDRVLLKRLRRAQRKSSLCAKMSGPRTQTLHEEHLRC